MKKEEKITECCSEKMIFKHHRDHNCGGGAIYGLGVVGAMFYFLRGAVTFIAVMTGIGKAIFWPAFVIFRLLTYLQL
jgi:hypothetical protein